MWLQVLDDAVQYSRRISVEEHWNSAGGANYRVISLTRPIYLFHLTHESLTLRTAHLSGSIFAGFEDLIESNFVQILYVDMVPRFSNTLQVRERVWYILSDSQTRLSVLPCKKGVGNLWLFGGQVLLFLFLVSRGEATYWDPFMNVALLRLSRAQTLFEWLDNILMRWALCALEEGGR